MFIIPINRDDYEGALPYVLITLAVINGIILIATYIVGSPEKVFQQYGFIPAEMHRWTVFSSMFLHAGLWHYVGNFFFLWMFGYRVENAFGRTVFAAVYLICGVAAAIAHYLFNIGSTIPCVGASGAISGIAGCYLVLFPKSHFDLEIYFLRFSVKTISTTTGGAVGAWIAEQTLLGIFSMIFPSFSTAFWAHVGGFSMGVVLAAVLLKVSPEIRARGESIRKAKLARPRREIKAEVRYSRLAAPKLGGFVVDGRNLPIVNAHVSEVEADWKTPIRTVQTDAHGEWTMEAQGHETTYRLLFQSEPEFEEVRVRLRIHPKLDRDLRVNLPINDRVAAAAASMN